MDHVAPGTADVPVRVAAFVLGGIFSEAGEDARGPGLRTNGCPL
jgi:hypothetical protein